MNKIWPADVHIVGKDIIKFHAIYWPAFLFAANIEPPKHIICHGHWLMDGKKMSKSLGNVIDPLEFSKKYTIDGVRYILIRDGLVTSDNSINLISVLNTINADLCNTMANLFQRCSAKAINRNSIYPAYQEIEAYLNASDKSLINKLNSLRDECDKFYEKFSFYEVVHLIINFLKELNLLVQVTKPWVLIKETSNSNNLNELNKLFFLTFEALRICSILFNPIIPNLTIKILSYLNVDKAMCTFDNAVVDTKRTKATTVNANATDMLFKRLV